jgi:hypothetical protein
MADADSHVLLQIFQFRHCRVNVFGAGYAGFKILCIFKCRMVQIVPEFSKYFVAELFSVVGRVLTMPENFESFRSRLCWFQDTLHVQMLDGPDCAGKLQKKS